VGELYPKVADGIQQIHTNFFASPTDILVHPRRWGWALSSLDSTGRPLVTPYAPQNPLADNGALAASGVVGSMQGLPVSTDANVTITNNTDQDIILIGDFSQALLWTNDAPMFEMSRENRFGTGEIVVRARQYYAFSAAAYPKAFAKITGSGLTTPSF
jgi:HK97 family phage major capsid protein